MSEEVINYKQKCSICYCKSDRISLIAEKWLIEEIKKDHPEWTGKDGICHRCLDYYYSLLDNVQIVN